MIKHIVVFGIVFFVLFATFQSFNANNAGVRDLPYSEFMDLVKTDGVATVTIQNNHEVSGQLSNGDNFKTYNPESLNNAMVGDLLKNKVEIVGEEPEKPSLLLQILISWFPFLLLIGVWIFFMRQMQGGGGGAMGFGKSKAKLLAEDDISVTFKDVAGVEEAKEEVGELVDFLKDPSKFQKLGGRIPKGVLMVGPPGTGKTLLARAIAGEASVPFFATSGSDFVEMFVGVGASRVRDMFEEAKKKAPCIIFIDEIDAVGRQRGAGGFGGHDEREQTLNQMLVEMDGFEGNEGIIVIAATNRSDVLDNALLRPGRFDRQVHVGLPDVKGRTDILHVHMRKVPMADDVDAQVIARGTPGFSGADLANLVNEAALFAARKDRAEVTMQEFEEAKDKIMMGTERRSMVMTEDEKEMTAYHEAGHAIVGRLVPGYDPVHKVTIIPRGGALGVTLFLPEKDEYSVSREKLESRLSVAYGGRVAEALIYGEHKVSTGASGDIQMATGVARRMVTHWGFSDKIGPILFEESQSFGSSTAETRFVSNETANLINEEVRGLVDKNYERAETMLKENMDILHAMAEALMKYETIEKMQIDQLMNREEVTPPKGWEEKQSKQDDDDDKPSATVDIIGEDDAPSGTTMMERNHTNETPS